MDRYVKTIGHFITWEIEVEMACCFFTLTKLVFVFRNRAKWWCEDTFVHAWLERSQQQKGDFVSKQIGGWCKGGMFLSKQINSVSVSLTRLSQMIRA